MRILLSNGRFPVTIDIARQLHRAGHVVFIVDPTQYHICKFSRAVKKSYYVPAPHFHPHGYVEAVRKAVREQHIDMILPLHEEILHLAECGYPEIVGKLFAPAFPTLVRLHSKWAFSRILTQVGLDHPRTVLCQSPQDIKRLDLGQELALKPEFGRATAGVHHHTPGASVPDDLLETVSPGVRYVAQEWIRGRAYCSYAIAYHGRLTAFAVYPVEETLDGSSCVYFKAVDHSRIREYCAALARSLPGFTGQFALDFIENEETGRLVAIECNPRATSGVHLYSGTRELSDAITRPLGGSATADVAVAKPGVRRQVAPGMLMWDRAGGKPTLRRWLQHMGRLMWTMDVIFTWRDLAPTLTQPFFLTTYYKIAQERSMTVSEMFQDDLVWEPKDKHWDHVRALIDEDLRLNAKE
ncbi:hypothetical protein AURDEDRAFT_161817 [Auricularia subglabra TFB-10046 SS5]|nr:hypothetical protein AURDEDRAFT_161817 [Auricularia subglabra TFB-10046 SS5]